MYTLKGAIKTIGDIQQISDSFKKRVFVVVDSSGQYDQIIEFQAVQDRCEIIDKFVPGSEVEVTFFLRGREWTNPKDGVVRTFNSLDAWKVEPIGEAKTEQPSAEQLGDDSEGDDQSF